MLTHDLMTSWRSGRVKGPNLRGIILNKLSDHMELAQFLSRVCQDIEEELTEQSTKACGQILAFALPLTRIP